MDDLSTLKRNVLISVRPLYAKEIVEGRKTVELRRKFPGTEAAGGTVVIYSSSPVRAVVAVALSRAFSICPFQRSGGSMARLPASPNRPLMTTSADATRVLRSCSTR